MVYLIQDFEPGFYPWGPQYAQAYSTYDAGFRPLVNSASLARYVGDLSPTTPEAVFAPALDLGPLHAAAERWRPAGDDVVRVLFYARPGKPRNMYAAGVEALRDWADRLPEDVQAVVRLAGETIGEDVDLGPRARAEPLGKLSYDGYHDLLADSDVGLALMLSPHPGHLALELPLAGIPTVTNDFAGYRAPWVGGLSLSGTDPVSIADALLEVSESARRLQRHVPHDFQAGPRGDARGGRREVAASWRSGQLAGLEPQALPTDRGDQGGVARVVAELAAYPAEVHVDRLRRGPERRVPDLTHQLVARDDLAGVGHQRVHEVELLAREDISLSPTQARRLSGSSRTSWTSITGQGMDPEQRGAGGSAKFPDAGLDDRPA